MSATGRREETGRGLVRLLPLLAVAAVAIAAALLLRPQRGPAAGPLPVTVTVAPQAWLVETIGGDRVAVDVLLPPGADEHSYEATPQQIGRLATARLVVEVGHPGLPLEAPLLAAVERREPRPEVVSMTAEAAGLGADAPPAADPHVWLAPPVMAATARRVAAALIRLDPQGEARYRRGRDAALAEIAAVDATLRGELAALPRRRFIVYHPSWEIVARRYGLEQVAIEAGGKEPSPRQLVALVAAARADGARVIFVQPATPERSSQALAAEIGARLVPLDPMAGDWPANLRRVAGELRKELGG